MKVSADLCLANGVASVDSVDHDVDSVVDHDVDSVVDHDVDSVVDHDAASVDRDCWNRHGLF